MKMCVHRFVTCAGGGVRTWLKDGQTPVRVSKHQFALLGGVPSEEADIRQEGVGFFVHCDSGVGPLIGPDVEGTALGDERHSFG